MERPIETLHRGLIGVQPAPPEEVAEAAAQKVCRGGGFPVGWLIAPGVAWLMLFLVVPLASIILRIADIRSQL